MTVKIYISTPINARGEATFEEKYEAARKRVEEIAAWLKKQQPEAETVSTFDGRPKPDGSTEAQALGRCVQQVLECDAICLDYGWERSSGCHTEFDAAKNYRKQIFRLHDIREDRKKYYEHIDDGAITISENNKNS